MSPSIYDGIAMDFFMAFYRGRNEAGTQDDIEGYLDAFFTWCGASV